ncbi:cyclic-di-AMP-binding protein CbpB [Facklamia miroungae]|uniref:CBS domain-containing protein n=1 Tax=Facklamia miroungae TaxID=120956 RepID=A0A1G7QXR8_9LACT|nr:cyclic-di-AMP-binding protein CbpB [Facklamia miroungae]NKZ29104.1 CBS domain-containing protein [Facklamia miroungae]SDG03318.1 CBS domain-containing protein [Facklamia miroungae]
MIDPKLSKKIVESLDEVLISADDVAYLYDFNSLIHGLLVLNQVDYSMIPVVNQHDQIVGLVSINMIVKEAISLEDIDFDNLNHKLIKHLDLRKPEFITMSEDLESILHKLVDNNFLCVVENHHDKKFLGIITRNMILKRINAFLHRTCLNDLIITDFAPAHRKKVYNK